MPGLEDLYREIILDHYKTPRNRGSLETPPAVHSIGHNPLCGDEIEVFLIVEAADSGAPGDAIVADVKIGGQGCSISQSSASLMTQAVIGKTVTEAQAIIRRFKSLVGVDVDEQPGDESIFLGDLQALQGVVKFPVRIKCAVLGWNTFAEALETASAAD